MLYAFDALELPTGELEKLTAHSLGSVVALGRELTTVRQCGYAVTCSELEVGLDAVAAPVHGADGEVVAAVGISGPNSRLDGTLHEIGESLVEHGRSLTRLLRPRMRRRV